MSEPDPLSAEPADWTQNYFNYFTEVEEHFQRARGSALFLLSPLDWALIENWRASGIPLEAVLKGIDEAFDKWRSRKVRRKMINSVAYCSQAVLEAANRSRPSSGRANRPAAEAPFAAAELATHLGNVSARLRERPETALHEVSASLENLAAHAEEHLSDLESLEQRLCAMEDKITAAVRASQTDEDLFSMRQALEAELRPYRGKMTADQISMLERRYLDTALLERANLPRLSLFYMH